MKNEILIVTPKLNGGITQVVNILIKGNLGRNHPVKTHYTTFEGKGLKKIGNIILQFLFFSLKVLFFRPALVHIHISSYGSMYRKMPYIFTCHLLKIKLLSHIHPTHFIDFIHAIPLSKQKRVLKYLNWSLRIIALTQNVKRDLRPLIHDHIPIDVVANPIILKDYQYDDSIVREDNHLVFVSSILPTKGVYELLDAAELVKKEIPNFKLSYYGNKENDKLKNKISEKGLESFIHVHGWIDFDRKVEVLRKATALILPTHTEGIPNILLECMALSTPIITTEVGGIPTIIEDNKNGLFFPVHDTIQMSSKIITLFKSNDLKDHFRKNGLEIIQQFDVSNINQQITQLYDELLTSNPSFVKS